MTTTRNQTKLPPPPDGLPPVVNTHLHLPPNFSAFETAEDAVDTGARAGARVLGASNFHDTRVYERFAARASALGIHPLLGVELIATLENLEASGTRVNDPANPGRIYLCGKAVAPISESGPDRSAIAAQVRAADEG